MTRNDEENARKFACPRCGAAAAVNCRGIAAGRVHMERLHVARAADRAKTPAEALERMSADLRRLLAEIGPGDQLKQQTAGAAMRWSRKLAAGGYLGAYLTRQVEEGERLGVLRRAAGSPPTMVLSEFGLTVQAAMREAA